jgi:hypothetical protein
MLYINKPDGVSTPAMCAADGRGVPSKGEQAQWTKQYLACAAELSQWEVVAEYASVTENYAQMAECLWRLHDWMRLKDIVLPKANVRRHSSHTLWLSQLSGTVLH